MNSTLSRTLHLFTSPLRCQVSRDQDLFSKASEKLVALGVLALTEGGDPMDMGDINALQSKSAVCRSQCMEKPLRLDQAEPSLAFAGGRRFSPAEVRQLLANEPETSAVASQLLRETATWEGPRVEIWTSALLGLCLHVPPGENILSRAAFLSQAVHLIASLVSDDDVVVSVGP
ncbi:hypothetical protein DENSPDRAFT_855709, partial [Dentipellis sp. KUC8613]